MVIFVTLIGSLVGYEIYKIRTSFKYLIENVKTNAKVVEDTLNKIKRPLVVAKRIPANVTLRRFLKKFLVAIKINFLR